MDRICHWKKLCTTGKTHDLPNIDYVTGKIYEEYPNRKKETEHIEKA
jgi:hypothetical protein